MTSSRKTDSDKAAKYAIAASKGFSYYLPKSAHRHLQELLKHLPSAARSIYDEYYRDLMCAKACAPESAAAMTKFVTSSFPKIAKKHNAFAREMNEEIDINEHEGYEPVKFPIVAEPDIDEEEAATVADTGKKRKRAPAGFTSFPNHGATPQKKAKAKPEIIPAAVSGSPATPPSSSPGRTLRSPVQANSDDQAAEVGTATPSLTEDVRHLTPESVRYADDYRNSRYSSPLSDVPSSAQLSDEDKPFEEPETRPNADDQDLLQRQHNVSADLIDGHDQEDNLSPLPFQALLRSMDDDLPTAPGGFDAETEMAIDHEALRQSSPVPVISPVTSPLENPVEATSTDASTLEKDTEKISEDVILSGSFTGSDYVLMSEEERWEDSVQALEDFDWNRKGSQWPDGPGLVSIHHEEVGQSAAIFKGNYWDDAGAEVLLPGTDHNLAVSDDESPADVV